MPAEVLSYRAVLTAGCKANLGKCRMTSNSTILLIDDDPVVRRGFVRLLNDTSYRIIEADSAETAIDLCKSERPHFVFVDVDLGGISGAEFIRTVCGERPQILVAVMSEQSQEHVVIESLEAGAKAHVKKPLSAVELRSVLSHFTGIETRRLNRAFNPGLLVRGKTELELCNSSRVVSPAVECLLRLVRGLVDDSTLSRLELGLKETLQNAYEHGNCGIDFEEKRVLCAAGELEKMLQERSQEAKDAEKRIHVSAEVKDGQFACTVEDDGEGFDWKTEKSPEDALEDLHGRGIFLVKKIFDEVKYNKKGNAVTLIKKL